jgi:hypothetical protein
MKKSILLFAIIFSFISCSKDDEPMPVTKSYFEENFLNGYLNSANFYQKTTLNINSGAYEFGLFFTPLVKGKITSLYVKIPDVNPSLRITIWDVTNNSIVRTEIINVLNPNITNTINIDDIELTKDKEYAITMNSNDWYNREKTDASSVVYPIISGNIRLNSYKWKNGTVQELPTIIDNKYYAGDLSFNFLQME